MRGLFTFDVEGSLFEAGIAETEEELEQVFRLRHQVYAERLGQVSVSEGGLERDWCDNHSWHVVARIDGELVGVFRLIDCSKGYLLEEGEFDGQRFSLPRTNPHSGEEIEIENTVEGSRWIALPSPVLASGRRIHVAMQLMKAVMLACRALGKHHLLGAVHVPELRRFVDVYHWPAGFIFPGEYDYHGSRVCVVIFAVSADYNCPMFRD